MKKKESIPSTFYHFYPTTVAVIAVKAGHQVGAMSVAWHTAVSHTPPLYGILIAPKRNTHALIRKAKHFTVNFLPFEKAEVIACVGRISGKEVNKFNAFGIKTDPSVKIGSPILRDAYASYECVLHGIHRVGDHAMILGKIVQVHTKTAAFDAAGLPNLASIHPALYLGSDRYIQAVPKNMRVIGKADVERILAARGKTGKY